MSKIKNDGLDQYGAEPFEQQQFGTAGVEGVNDHHHLFYSDISIVEIIANFDLQLSCEALSQFQL